ncbi:MAG TPA: hypothetical protein VMS60_05010 [Solirubrobacterales bacterium]|nr:hypothetical protein [Solirubrobacterales bacterium]
MKTRTPKITFANAIALIALFASLGGTVYAAAKINGKTIRKASIPADRFQADSLTGVQINEGSLDTVARAERAVEAKNALRAGSAPRASAADQADTAASADRAATARTVPEATHAGTADAAGFAQAAGALGGVPPSSYLRDCEGRGAVKGYVLFDPQRAGAPKLSEFNCSGAAVQVQKVDGDYNVTFPGANGATNGANIGVGTAFGLHSLIGVRFLAGPNVFEVELRSSEGPDRDLSNEKWSLVVF